MRVVLTFVLTLSLVGVVQSVAHACSCAVGSPAMARRAAGFVFEGTVVSMTQSGNSGTARAVFRVERVWKGSVSRRFTVQVPAQPSMCPPHFADGQRYIVYAEDTDAGPRVGACARYAAGSGLQRERESLGAPVAVHRNRPPPPG